MKCRNGIELVRHIGDNQGYGTPVVYGHLVMGISLPSLSVPIGL